MPAGKMNQVLNNSSNQDLLDEMLKKEKKNLNVPDDIKCPEINIDHLDKLFATIKDKGYMSINTSQEVNLIQYAISETYNHKEQKEVLDMCHNFFPFILNLANMFLVHYKENSTTSGSV